MWNLDEYCKLVLKGKRNNNALSASVRHFENFLITGIGWAVSRDQLALNFWEILDWSGDHYFGDSAASR